MDTVETRPFPVEHTMKDDNVLLVITLLAFVGILTLGWLIH